MKTAIKPEAFDNELKQLSRIIRSLKNDLKCKVEASKEITPEIARLEQLIIVKKREEKCIRMINRKLKKNVRMLSS